MKQPLAEVFGHLITDQSNKAVRYRTKRLCPFPNKVPNCTKDKASDPLGVCSIFENSSPVIACPVRFRQNWQIAEDAARFFFAKGTSWTSLTEVRLTDADGKSAGNIDLVLVSYDCCGKVTGFGAVEVQAVYISGNARRPFQAYMSDPAGMASMDWTSERNYPRADYLSSSREMLAKQLLVKRGILHAWGKKTAIAIDRCFFDTLPDMQEVPEGQADVAWLVYDLVADASRKAQAAGQVKLALHKVVYSAWPVLLVAEKIPVPEEIRGFTKRINVMLDDVAV